MALAILLSANGCAVYGFHSSVSTPRRVKSVSPSASGSVGTNPCLSDIQAAERCTRHFPQHILNVQSNRIGGNSDVSSEANDAKVTKSVTHQLATDAAPATPLGEIETIGSDAKVVHAQNKITAADKVVIWTALAGIAFAFASVIRISGPGAWRYYVAGGICAAVSHGITTPIDVVKASQEVVLLSQ